MLKLPASALGLLLAAPACSAAAPASLVLSRGHVLTGESAISLEGGRIDVGDGRIACTGRYLPPGDARTFTLTLTCTDGRLGVAVIVRDATTAGHGRMFFTDGSNGRLSFGG